MCTYILYSAALQFLQIFHIISTTFFLLFYTSVFLITLLLLQIIFHHAYGCFYTSLYFCNCVCYVVWFNLNSFTTRAVSCFCRSLLNRSTPCISNAGHVLVLRISCRHLRRLCFGGRGVVRHVGWGARACHVPQSNTRPPASYSYA